jgi:hypothetical protein
MALPKAMLLRLLDALWLLAFTVCVIVPSETGRGVPSARTAPVRRRAANDGVVVAYRTLTLAARQLPAARAARQKVGEECPTGPSWRQP